jgi:hypothetical protein
MKQQTLLGELFFPGNWWRCRRPTLCEKVVGITDQLLTTDLRMCLCKMRMAPVKAWEFHHSYNHIYIDIYIYIYTYIYIHVILQNQAQSCTSWLIWVCCDMLWCDHSNQGWVGWYAGYEAYLTASLMRCLFLRQIAGAVVPSGVLQAPEWQGGEQATLKKSNDWGNS